MGKEHEGMGKGPMGKEHEGMGKGPMGKEPMGKEHEGMGEGPLLKLADELALTSEQKAKLKAKLEAQMKANRATMKTKLEAAHKHLEAIGTAFEGDKFDAKKAGVGTLAPDMIKTMATHKLQFVETVLAALTPDQRSKFAAHLKEHAHDMDEGG
jgi:Spy/CpxP family protein refolding chaperone